MQLTLSLWSTDHTPTETVLSSIAISHAPALQLSLTSATEHIATATKLYEFYSLSQVIRGAQASLAVIRGESTLATATALAVRAKASEAIFDATLNLKALEFENNMYGTYLKHAPNIIYLVLFGGIFSYLVGMLYKSRYHWFNVTFVCGYALEVIGFIGRILSFKDLTNLNYFLCGFVSLTIAPALIMGGIYILFAQCVVIHGRKFSVLKPMWYSYFFIVCDLISLVIQAIGGATSSAAAQDHSDPQLGTNIMIAGIAFQVAAMTVFLIFWLEFLRRLYFKKFDDKNVPGDYHSHPLAKPSVRNFVKLLFNTPSVRAYIEQYREPVYNPRFASIRNRKMFPYFPLFVTIAVLAIYIRCVYRVVELAQGFSGYLITHEVYLMVLDALMIAICGLIFIPMHPVWVFGASNLVKVRVIKSNEDEEKEVECAEREHDATPHSVESSTQYSNESVSVDAKHASTAASPYQMTH